MSRFTAFQLFLRQCLLYPLTSPFLPPEDKVEDGYSYAAGQKTGTLTPTPPQGLPKTGQTWSYGNEDDGYYKKGYPETGDRFTDNGDGTITDKATGLMWVKDPSQLGGVWGTPGSPARQSFVNAIAECETLNYAGHTDWRLPNLFELLSLIKWTVSNPCIDTTFFVNTQTGVEYGCSTSNIFHTQWRAVSFGSGYITGYAYTITLHVRPVRLGVPA